ncbi:MAG TPA: CHASE sensor domain-containing protein, partial [Vicinamibacteria bacterium]|nr:CHASE sensor domain-containing protein [Vicinamibacteria bacterium]
MTSPFRRLSIKGKLLGITMATTLVAVVVACAAFVYYDIQSFKRQMKEDLRVVAQGIAINSTPALEFESLESAREILAALRADPHLETAVIFDREKNAVSYVRGDLPQDPPAPPLRADGTYFEDDKLRIYHSVVRAGEPLGMVFIQSDMEELRDRLGTYARVVAVVVLLSLVTGLVLASAL